MKVIGLRLKVSINAAVAQRIRASVYGTEGRGFESLQPHHSHLGERGPAPKRARTPAQRETAPRRRVVDCKPCEAWPNAWSGTCDNWPYRDRPLLLKM
jgi:hypothetical protein